MKLEHLYSCYLSTDVEFLHNLSLLGIAATRTKCKNETKQEGKDHSNLN
jgi:hypothetical protein